jgi:hypothetical protein
MGVIAEFVAESGIGSGVVEVLRKSATPPELCVFPPKSASSSIYFVHPGEDPVESARCEASSIGDRCMVTVKACGAQELRFSWTAPPQYDDSVWFAAGFVSTDRISGTPASDSVSTIAGPLQPTTSGSGGGYQSDLQNDCAISRVSGHPASRQAGLLTAVGLLVVTLARSRRRRRWGKRSTE